MTLEEFLAEWHSPDPKLLVYTSGSTGSPQPLWVEKRHMEASARATIRFLHLRPGDTALLCMPLDFIAGKMMVVRALCGQLQLVSTPPSSHPLALLADSQMPITLAAMVPMQVWNTLQQPVEAARLARISHLLIGGGAIDPALETALATLPCTVWSTYGMTETLSHIALRRVNGPEASPWYTPMPQVAVTADDEGRLVVDAPDIGARQLVTNDLVETRDDGRFRILGRRDNVVCSGGIKIQIEEVERLLRLHTTVPFIITWRKDPSLGQALTLLTEAGNQPSLRTLCQKVLPRFWQPRHYMNVSQLPLTATSKPARHEAWLLANSGRTTP